MITGTFVKLLWILGHSTLPGWYDSAPGQGKSFCLLGRMFLFSNLNITPLQVIRAAALCAPQVYPKSSLTESLFLAEISPLPLYGEFSCLAHTLTFLLQSEYLEVTPLVGHLVWITGYLRVCRAQISLSESLLSWAVSRAFNSLTSKIVVQDWDVFLVLLVGFS